MNKKNQQRENVRVLGFSEWGLLILLHIGLYLLITPLVNGLDEIALDMLEIFFYPVNGLIYMVMLPVAIILLGFYLGLLMILPLILGFTTSLLISKKRMYYKSMTIVEFFLILIIFTWSNLWLNNTALLSGVIEAFLASGFIYLFARGKDKSGKKTAKRKSNTARNRMNKTVANKNSLDVKKDCWGNEV